MRRAQLGGESDGLPRFEIEPVHVGAVALQRLRAEAERGGDGGDAAGVELGPKHAAIGQRVTRRDEPPDDAFGSRIGQREDEPAGIGARRRGRHRHAADIAVGPRRRLDLQPVAAALVQLALGGNVDFFLIGLDRNRLDGVSEPHRQKDESGKQDAGEQSRMPAPSPGRRSTSHRGAQLRHSSPISLPAYGCVSVSSSA